MKNLGETVKLLNHIQEKPEATQRELVDRLGVSLGKVNFLLKALTEKGIIKFQSFKNSKNKMAYLYVITPSGIKEKTILTKNFLETKIEEYNKVKEEIESLKSFLKIETRRNNEDAK